MTNKPLILLIFFMAGMLCLASAQQKDIKFTSLTTKDGLSSNTVNAILKDRYGLLWFGTEDGLDKFDGTNFTIYRHKPGEATSLQANEILALHEDKAGNLWIGTSGGSLSMYDRKRDAFVNYPANRGPNTIVNNVILDICSDYVGKIWIATFEGVSVLDPRTKQITTLPFPPGRNASFNKVSMCIFADSRRQIWIGTNEGLYLYQPASQSLKRFVHSAEHSSGISGDFVNAVAEDKKGNLWIATNGGISLLKPGSSEFINYKPEDEGLPASNHYFSSIGIDKEELWVGTTQGLSVFNTITGTFTSFRPDRRNIHSLSGKSIRSVFIDNQGIYWLGTSGGGVNKYDQNLNLFNFVQSNSFDEKGLNVPIVTSFVEGEDGQVYVGTDGGGLSLFDTRTKLFKRIPIKSRINSGNPLRIVALEMNRKQELMIGTYGDGLIFYNEQSGKMQQLVRGTNDYDLNSNDIYCIREDREGRLWVGTNGDGINVLNEKMQVVVRYTPNPKSANDVLLPINGYIRDILQDKDGDFWIATHGGGIALFHPSKQSFTIYSSINSKLRNDKVQTLSEGRDGFVWAGTFGGGVSLINKKTNEFITYSEKEGLQNSTVYKIVEEKKGVVWLSTNKGISSIEPGSKKVNNYNYHNGVQNNNFVRGAGIQLKNGDLYFGGLEGINYFNPDNLKKNNSVPSILISDLRISNRSVSPSEDGPIQEHISVAKEINLEYKQNFALSFVGLNFTSAEQNEYAYKLEGFDKDWNYVGNSTTASYTNLDPGNYTFHVKASNNDGIWNAEGTSIAIYVHPPFWRTIYAYVFYTLALIGLIIFFRYRSIRKLQMKFALEQEKMHTEQERKETQRILELDRLKIKFLTNLSHEFRTPISLILGPVDKLMNQEKNEQSHSQLYMIKRNARRLLNLVNQLLDFRKMEEQELKLHTTEGELVSFIKEVSDSFKDLSERKKIEFTFNSEIDQLHTVFDQDKMERILFNVLSNAFKFTLEGGRIQLDLQKIAEPAETSKTWVAIKVSDTGIGIAEDKKEKIFERFFQDTTAASILNQGTGIGLSITKEFVKMHGGTIHVESIPQKGSTFIIQLPFSPITEKYIPEVLQEASTTVNEIPPPIAHPEAANNVRSLKEQTEMPSILIVEDNEDFRFYLKDNLRSFYKVFEAGNGKEGWQSALAHHPQLIVSDISMPYMNGIELSRKLKSDKRTNHIPVILLTALTGEEEQLKGLETGANDYITKPFNFEVLNAKIKNLLTLNNTLKSTYSKQLKVPSPDVQVESADEKLLHEIMHYLEENLTNVQLSVEELSKHVGMSRSSLYSKLLELTGQTPVEFIRSVKLDKAAILLEKSDMNVAQIAYSVGFSTPNYFAKSFKAKFNMLPSEYLHKVRKAGHKKMGDEATQGSGETI